ncbi:MAG: hypothetical protein AAFY24_11735, partial [Pseudomonadota bacterium]
HESRRAFGAGRFLDSRSALGFALLVWNEGWVTASQLAGKANLAGSIQLPQTAGGLRVLLT